MTKILFPIFVLSILSTFSPSFASDVEEEARDVTRTSSPMPETALVKDVLFHSSSLGWGKTLRKFLEQNSAVEVTQEQLTSLLGFVLGLPDHKAYGQVLSHLGLALTVQDLSKRNGHVLYLSELMQSHYDALTDLLNVQIFSANMRILQGIVEQEASARTGVPIDLKWSEEFTPAQQHDKLLALALKAIEGLKLKVVLQHIIQVVFEDDPPKRDEQLAILEKLAEEKKQPGNLVETSFQHLGLMWATFYSMDDLVNVCLLNDEYYTRKNKVPPFVALLWADEENIGTLLADSIATRNQDIMEELSFGLKRDLYEAFQVKTSSHTETLLAPKPHSPLFTLRPEADQSDDSVSPRMARESDLEDHVEESTTDLEGD